MKNKPADKNETDYGTKPVLLSEKKYGFIDAFLILSGYCIATWSYTQGSYLATLVGFRQLLVGAFFGALLMLLIYQLPVILSARYGIDIWIWLKAAFGPKGVTAMTIIIIVINFPWYAVCCDLFASSAENLFALFGVTLPHGSHLFLSLLCVALGTFIALKGVTTITWTTRILVPLLILVGAAVVCVGFKSIPAHVIWNYRPSQMVSENSVVPYVLSIEANFAFVITLVGGMAEIPRLCKKEKSAFYAGVLGQGLSGSFFVVVGAVMAIAMEHATGQLIDDPTLMLATLTVPAMAFASLLLVSFANIGTQAVGSYIYGVMLKTTFPKAKYSMLVIALAVYVSVLCVWGKIIDFFGSFLTISACIYAPLAAVLFVDFFFIRKQKIDLKGAYGISGHNNYYYTNGFNLAGLSCIIFGFIFSLAIYNPITQEIHCKALFMLTPTGASFLATGLLYFVLVKIPYIRRYCCKDIYLYADTKPFDRNKTPPKLNLFLTPIIWLYCFIATRKGKLKITRTDNRGIKPPFLVLGTHQSFTDFLVTPLALFPRRANYVSELEGFEYYGEWIYRQIGCLGTRKFVDDFALISNIRKIMKRKGILVLYPEARYANIGTSSRLEKSVAKLVKLLKVPVVTLNMKGNYLQSPIWNLKTRKEAKLNAHLDYILTKDEVMEKSVDEIHETLSRSLEFNEYRYQRENNILITDKDQAEGLHKPLYRCPSCKTEYRMQTKGREIFCCQCGLKYYLRETGTLVKVSANNDTPENYFIPDWYEDERSAVYKEIEEGRYTLECDVKIEALPNAKNFISMGNGHLVQKEEGFYLTFSETNETMFFNGKTMPSLHTEYDYRGKGMCITLSTLDNTYFLFPLTAEFNPTKIQFAVEYFYRNQTPCNKAF